MTLQPLDHANQVRIETVESFDFGSKAYADLFAASNATAFQAPLWLRTFYDILVPGTGAEALIVTVYLNGSSYPDMIMPLVRETHFGIRILQPADLGVADYNAMIGRPEILELLAENPETSRRIREAIQPYDLFLFRKQPPNVFDATRLIPGSRKTANISSSYEAQVGQDFDSWYKASVSKNMRKGMKRKRNGFRNDYGELKFVELTDKAAIEDAFSLMRDMRAVRYETDLFSRPEYYDFYRSVAVRGAQQDVTSTFVGISDDKILTVDFGLRHKERFLFLLGGFSNDSKYQRYSLGLIGLSEIIRHEAGTGRSVFDFTIGDEDYKKSFGADRIQLMNVTATSGLLGRLALSAYQSRGALRGVLKTLLPRFN